jgi:hypothetical protein
MGKAIAYSIQMQVRWLPLTRRVSSIAISSPNVMIAGSGLVRVSISDWRRWLQRRRTSDATQPRLAESPKTAYRAIVGTVSICRPNKRKASWWITARHFLQAGCSMKC